LGSSKIKIIEKTPDNEKIFLEHHSFIRQKAQQLLPHSKEEAEDLVQDMYISFVHSQAIPETDDEHRLRGYLSRTLRNLFISKSRRKGTDALSSLLVSDFDSVEFALMAVDRSRLLVVRSDLATICEYACIRRWTNRAASVLILRFFFGYLPSEIMKVLRSRRTAVDKLTHTARLEARLYLTKPGSLVFMGTQRPETPLFPPYLPDDPADLNAELQRRIFSQRDGECLPPSEIVERYSQSSDSTFSTGELAHIVSCSSCLDRVNEVLGLPRLSMRFFSDSNEPRDGGPKDPGPDASGMSQPTPSTADDERSQLRRRSRENFEHRPTTLQVAVDGLVLGSTLVSSVFSEITLTLDVLHPEFVEVLSEQGRRLLYLDLMPSEEVAAEPGFTKVILSDDRTLRAELAWGSGAPVVNVSYHDPLMTDEEGSSFLEFVPALSAVERYAFAAIKESAEKRVPLRKKLLFPLLDADWVPMIKFASATGILLLMGGLFLYFFERKSIPIAPTAKTLLSESIQSEARLILPHGAVHKTFAFEVRSGNGKLIESGKVETFKGANPNRQAIRLLSSNGKLLAGNWVDQTGKVTEYPSRKGLATQDNQLLFAQAWEHAAEADDFQHLAGDTSKISVQTASSTYDLGYSEQAPPDTEAIVSAHLILASDTKRPVAETLRIQDHRQTREYRFQQLTYEMVPAGPELERDFTPQVELASLHPRIPGESSAGVSGPHLTLEVLQLLSNLGPDVERIVDVERMPDGSVGINGVFQTADERTAVQRVFAPLQSSHQLRVVLHSGDEPLSPETYHKSIVLEALNPISLKDGRIPLDAELRSALLANGVPEDELETRIHVLATSALQHCSDAHREAWSIRQIAANDFSRAELQSMHPGDRMLWLTLLDKHIRAYSVELTAIGSDLTPLFASEKAPFPPSLSVPPVPTIAELDTIADTLNQDSEHLDRLLTSALTLSTSDLPANQNARPIEQLLAALRTKESRLHSTIERLQVFGQADRTE
jgi:DNA-directed RNA polymerase specialized sigma24 family protein